MTPLAHVGHWYHVLLYLAPVFLVGAGLWYAGKRLPEEGEFEDYDDGDDPHDLGRPIGP